MRYTLVILAAALCVAGCNGDPEDHVTSDVTASLEHASLYYCTGLWGSGGCENFGFTVVIRNGGASSLEVLDVTLLGERDPDTDLRMVEGTIDLIGLVPVLDHGAEGSISCVNGVDVHVFGSMMDVERELRVEIRLRELETGRTGKVVVDGVMEYYRVSDSCPEQLDFSCVGG